MCIKCHHETKYSLFTEADSLFHTKGGGLYLNHTVLAGRNLDRCEYKAITWESDSYYTYSEALVKKEPPYEMTVKHDFFKIECYLKKENDGTENVQEDNRLKGRKLLQLGNHGERRRNNLSNVGRRQHNEVNVHQNFQHGPQNLLSEQFHAQNRQQNMQSSQHFVHNVQPNMKRFNQTYNSEAHVKHKRNTSYREKNAPQHGFSVNNSKFVEGSRVIAQNGGTLKRAANRGTVGAVGYTASNKQIWNSNPGQQVRKLHETVNSNVNAQHHFQQGPVDNQPANFGRPKANVHTNVDAQQHFQQGPVDNQQAHLARPKVNDHNFPLLNGSIQRHPTTTTTPQQLNEGIVNIDHQKHAVEWNASKSETKTSNMKKDTQVQAENDNQVNKENNDEPRMDGQEANDSTDHNYDYNNGFPHGMKILTLLVK